MQRRRLLTVSAILLASAVAGRRGLAAADPRPLVVASFTILADLCREVGGEHVRVVSLVGPDGDPHTYEPRPGDLRNIAACAVLVENGLGLEGWMTRLPAAASFKGVRIIASEGVTPRSFVEDGATTTDPHAWQDPANAVIYVRNIASGLGRAVPAGAADFSANAAKLGAAIEAEGKAIARTMDAIPAAKRKIITTHDAFGYYAARYGIELHSVEGISTEDEPSAKTVTALADQVRREHIKAVFAENMTDPRLARTLAKESGAVVGPPVYSDALSPPQGPAPTYISMLRHNTAAFARAMAEN